MAPLENKTILICQAQEESIIFLPRFSMVLLNNQRWILLVVVAVVENVHADIRNVIIAAAVIHSCLSLLIFLFTLV